MKVTKNNANTSLNGGKPPGSPRKQVTFRENLTEVKIIENKDDHKHEADGIDAATPSQDPIIEVGANIVPHLDHIDIHVQVGPADEGFKPVEDPPSRKSSSSSSSSSSSKKSDHHDDQVP